jgi:hypothetical protein
MKVNALDLSPNYAGTNLLNFTINLNKLLIEFLIGGLMAITNGIAALTGLFTKTNFLE